MHNALWQKLCNKFIMITHGLVTIGYFIYGECGFVVVWYLRPKILSKFPETAKSFLPMEKIYEAINCSVVSPNYNSS